MKKTQWIELVRKIRFSSVSFIAVFIFVACAVALLAGIGWCQTSLSLSLDREFDRDGLHDMEIVFPFGAEESDVVRIRQQEDVSAAEGQYTSFQFFRWEQEMFQARLIRIPHEMDHLVILEGRLPVAFDEIAVEEKWAADYGLHPGDEIAFLHDGNEDAHLLHGLLENNLSDIYFCNEDGMQYLTTDRFTVTAVVRSPVFISKYAAAYESSPTYSTPVNCLMFVTEEAFDPVAFNGFTSVIVRSERLRNLPTVSDSYKETAQEISRDLRPLADEINEKRYNRSLNAVNSFNGTPFETIIGPVRDEMTWQSCTLLLRENNGSIVMSEYIGSMFGKLKYNVALVFAIIGVFICYSTILRLVFKDMVLIGTRKAVGFTDREIILPYLIYAFAATALGVLVGIIAARFVVQPILIGVMNDTFCFGDAVYYFSFGETAVYFLAEAAVMVLFALIACRKTLKREITGLLAGSEPPASKNHFWENTEPWTKLSVLSKSIINNFLNDRRRVIATLVGIAGCTVLLVSSVSLELSVIGSLPKQFSRIQQYDTVIYFKPDAPGCEEAIADALSGVTDRYAEIYTSNAAVKAPDGKLLSSYMIVGDNDFNGLFSLYRTDGSPASADRGLWISCAYANHYHLREGDEITYLDSASAEHTVKIAGIYEFYLQCPRLIMSREEYETEFGTAPAENTFILSSGGMKPPEFDALLSDIDGYISTVDYYAFAEESQSTIESLATATMVMYIVLSVIIAFMVLLDLLVMFVEERRKELITLMINGYTVGEAKRYIYSDTILLTVAGILSGVILGVLSGRWNVNSMESELSYFLHQTSFPACVIGIAFSALLTACMTVIAMRRISTFELSDLNKGG